MLNKNPIFINGFQRGGTNILLNLIGSHPEVCFIDGETHQVFTGRTSQPIKKWFNKLTYAPVLIAERDHLFSINRSAEPAMPASFMLRYIDMVFYLSKLTAARYNVQADSSTKSVKELAGSRMLGKNVNGIIFTSAMLHKMYPQATFIGLIRNGLALCEGFVRRGITADKFGRLYQNVCDQMLRDVERLPNYRIIRFEDLIANPTAVMEAIYDAARLDKTAVTQFRLQAKASMGQDGVRRNTFDAQKHKELRWFQLDEINGYFRQDVNDNQIARLSDKDKHLFLSHAQQAMAHFGYV